jgi:hypothetical protein
VTALKKPMIVVVALFLGFYLMQDPAGLAAFAKDAGVALWNMLTTLFEALIDFFNALQA